MKDATTRSDRFFHSVTAHARFYVVMGVALIVAALAFLPQLEKDTRSDAFLAADNPALLYRAKVKEQFGLSDPVIVAIQNTGASGVYNPETLSLVQWLSDEIARLPNVDAARLVSLATEKNITSSDEGIEIQPFFKPMPDSQVQADAVRDAVAAFPLYSGSLVAKDKTVTLIVVELADEMQQETSYQEVMEVVAVAPVGKNTSIHVAGEGALAGYLGSYIESDALRLNPLAWLIISLTIYYAYRRFNPVIMANVIIAASVLITLAAMAASGVPFYMITNALPVILIGISVADSIHIYSHFYTLQAKHPDMDTKALTVATMNDMWRPVTLTTLTTIAGFLGLYFAAYMPPFKYFGLFSALGVLIAWLYSMVFLPAALVLTKPKTSSRFSPDFVKHHSDVFGRAMATMGYGALRYARSFIVTFALLCGLGLYAAVQLLVDENPINIFHPTEPIHVADKLINEHMDGSNALDIVIETPEQEGLFSPRNLKKIEKLQEYAEQLPRVGGSISIVNYLKQMNKALNEGTDANYVLPQDPELVAQYFLLYSSLSDPTDFEEEIDYNYQTANVRVSLNSGNYQDFKQVVESLQGYIDREFASDDITATLTGRVAINYHWIGNLGRSHFAGMILALILVGGVSAILFRSVVGGLFTLIPVAASVLFVYAAMVVSGMTLGVGTSMFAAVTIGLGVDFSIHTLDKLRSLLSAGDKDDTGRAYEEFFQTTGRALLFNFLAIAFGFGVLMVSKVSSLNNFGALLVVAVSASFVGSLTVIPVMVKVFRPNFIINPGKKPESGSTAKKGSLALLLIAFILAIPLSDNTWGQDQLTAEQIVSNVNAVEGGEFVTRKMHMLMTDRRGQERSRQTISYRKYFGADKKTVLFFLEPSNVRDTAFLIWNYADPGEPDDQWLYLPALRKVRRVSAADRGDYFLGTDFTYEDMKLDGKFEPLDYVFTLVGEESLNGVLAYKIEGTPKNSDTAGELGYSRTVSWVDPATWVLLKAEFYDLKNQLLKTLVVSDISQVDGYWTRNRLTMQNHQTGHTTEFVFSEVDYATPVADSLFTQQALARGH